MSGVDQLTSHRNGRFEKTILVTTKTILVTKVTSFLMGKHVIIRHIGGVLAFSRSPCADPSFPRLPREFVHVIIRRRLASPRSPGEFVLRLPKTVRVPVVMKYVFVCRLLQTVRVPKHFHFFRKSILVQRVALRLRSSTT